MKKLRALTLMELMVTIAIVGLLASAAVPAYKSYVDGSKLNKAVNLFKTYSNQVVSYYNANGVFPSVAKISPGSIPSSGDNGVIFEIGGVNSATGANTGMQEMFYQHGSDWFALNVVVAAGTTGNSQIDGKNMHYKGRVNNGLFTFACGQWDVGSDYIDSELLPTSCDQTNLINF